MKETPTLDIEMWDLDKIKPYQSNPRLNDAAVDPVARSIQEFGFRQPIVVDKDGWIVVGHTRDRAAQKLGLKSVPVHVARGLSESQIRAYRIADNKTHEFADWDWDALANELAALRESDFDLELTGFDLVEIAEIEGDDPIGGLTDPNDAPSLNDVPAITQRGDVWEMGGSHRLLCGDSGNAEDVSKLMDGEQADLMITDPPYGVSYVGKTKDALTIKGDDVSEEELAVNIQHWFDCADQATRDGAYWFATVPAGPLHGLFLNDWKQRGILRQVLVWVKDCMVLGKSEYHYRHEPILFGWKPGVRMHNDDRTRTSVWEFDRPKKSEVHPTMKPVELWMHAIKHHSKKGDLLYEPFCGSGTSLIAAQRMGRRCYAMELSPKYCDVAVRRWEEFTGEQAQRIPA